MECNRVVLCGRILEKDELRYTPAGIPVVNFKIVHDSEQMEAGGKRQVQCEVNSIAFEQMALEIGKLKIDDSVQLEGFLSRKSRMSTQLVLHVNKYELKR